MSDQVLPIVHVEYFEYDFVVIICVHVNIAAETQNSAFSMHLCAYAHIHFIFHFSLWLEAKCLVALVVVEEE